VPVEVAEVVRRSISSFIETNGTLEAENEVDLVARISGPIVELLVEEGDLVQKDQLLARIDDEEIASQVEISEVALKEAKLSFERAEKLKESNLISPEEYDQAQTRLDTAEAQLEGNRVLLGFTEIRAPFTGLIVVRYIDFAQQMSPNAPLFRLSDFNPLLCPIQIPERDLSKVRLGQRAHLTFEGWPDERFEASVLRISPVVDATTGTVKVTLEVEARGRLRPGMFARVFVETDTRPDVLVIPKAALSLESLGDTVYVAAEGKADRREVDLGFREGDFVEAQSGVSEGERVVVVGQDGLSDGTPIRVLSEKEIEERIGRPHSTQGADEE
jgi:RND family efflux transporter MFP subunit